MPKPDKNIFDQFDDEPDAGFVVGPPPADTNDDWFKRREPPDILGRRRRSMREAFELPASGTAPAYPTEPSVYQGIVDPRKYQAHVSGENFFEAFDDEPDAQVVPVPDTEPEPLPATPGISVFQREIGTVLTERKREREASEKKSLDTERGGEFLRDLTEPPHLHGPAEIFRDLEQRNLRERDAAPFDPQQYAEFVKGIPPGAVRMVGTTIGGVAGAQTAYTQTERRSAIEQLARLNRLDRGEPFGAGPGDHAVLLEYRNMTPQERQEKKEKLRRQIDAERTPIRERWFYQAGQATQEFAKGLIPAAEGYENSIGRQLGEGIGSLIAGLPAGYLGRVPALLFFGSAGSGEAIDRAIAFDKTERKAGREGLSEQQIATSAMWGIAPGTTDLLPIEFLLGRFNVPQPFRRKFARAIGRIGGQAFIEGVQEGGQEFLQNLIAQDVYNPDQDLGEDILPSAGIGSGVGAIAETGRQLISLFGGRRRVATGNPQEDIKEAATAIDEAAQAQREQEAAQEATELASVDVPPAEAVEPDLPEPTTPVERARHDVQRADPALFTLYEGGDFTSPRNRDFVAEFARFAVPSGERERFSRGGVLTPEGIDRMRGAVLAAAYEPPTVARLLESTDDDIRLIADAMQDAAGAFAALRTAIAGEETRPEQDVTPQLAEAVRIVTQLKRQNRSVADYLEQIDAHGSLNPAVEGFIRGFYKDDLRRVRPRRAIAGDLTRIAENARRAVESAAAGQQEEVAPAQTGEPQAEQPAGDIAPAVTQPGQQPAVQQIVRDPDLTGPFRGLSELIDEARRALGMTVRQGRLDPGLKRRMSAMGAGQVRGQYNRSTGVARMVVANDIETFAHEAGHHLETTIGQELENLKQRHASELTLMASPGPDALSEGFAEFFRKYLTNPSQAQQSAPNFHDAFEQFMSQRDAPMLERLHSVRDGYMDLQLGNPTDAKIANQTVILGRENSFTRFLRDAERNGVMDTMSDRLHWLYFAMIGKNHGWWYAAKQLMDIQERNTGQRVDLKAIDNPNKILRRTSHTTAWAMQDLKRGVATAARPNGGGVSIHDVLATAFGGTQKSQWNQQALARFGDYLISRRAIGLYIRYNPAFRQTVEAFVAQHPQLGYLLARLPQNAESTLENAPTYESLYDHLNSLLDHELRNPQFRQAAEMYYEFNKDMLVLLHEKGLLSDEDLGNLMQDNDYAPFQRDMSDRELVSGAAASRAGIGDEAAANKYDVFRTIRGSTRDIINPVQSTVQFVYEARLRAALNDTLRAMDRLAKAAGPGGGAIFERLPANEAKAYNVEIQQALKNAARDAGLSEYDTAYMLGNVEQFLGKNAATMMFTQQTAKERGERIVWFYENGKPVPARLADGTLGQMLFEGFTTMGRRSPDLWMKVLSVPALTVRAGVTYSFEFIFRNIFVDGLVAPVNSPYAKPYVTQIGGLANILGGATQDWLDQGGRFNFGVASIALPQRMRQSLSTALSGRNAGKYHRLYNRYAGMLGGEMTQAISNQSIERDIRRLRDQGFNIRVPRNVPELLKMVFQVGEFSETATRVGIYKNAYESALADGLSEYEAATEAAYAAHDVIDFSRHGSKTELLRRAIPFWNVAIIGPDKYVRSLTAQGDHGSAIMTYLKYRDGDRLTKAEKADLRQAARAWAYTTLVFGSMSFLSYMLGADDEDFDEIPDRIRATHWRFNIDGVLYLLPKDIRSFLDEHLPEDVTLRLPKGFETAWFANAVERALDAAMKEDPTAGERYLSDLWEITAPPSGIPGIDTYYEVIGNHNLYTGRPIIPFWEQELERQEQFGPYTSETAKVIGDAINMSPYHIDHIIRSLGASVARDVQTIIDLSAGKGPKPSIEDYPIARRFTYNTGRFSRSLGKFYDLRSGADSWFWDTVSSDARSFNAAKATYKRYVDRGETGEAEANAYYHSLNDDQKVFATLGVDFTGSKAKYRNLHPIVNADEAIRVAGNLMREVYEGALIVGNAEDREKLDRQKMRFARNELGHIRKGLAQNALHILGVRGWDQQRMIDVDKRLETLRQGAPLVYDELTRRLHKKDFVRMDHLDDVWPEVKERVLERRDKAFLGDLRAGGVITRY